MKDLALHVSLLFLIAFGAKGQGQWTWVKGDTAANTFYGIPGLSDPSFDPSARYSSTGWYDNNGGLWMCSGDSNNDIWRYSIDDNEWWWVKDYSATGIYPVYGPLGVASPTASIGQISFRTPHWVVDSNYLWALSPRTGDMFRFDIAQQNWAWMSGAGAGATGNVGYPVYGNLGAYADSVNPGDTQFGYETANQWVDSEGNFWLFQGKYGTVWKYSPVLNQWAWMHGAQAPAYTEPSFYTAIGEFDPIGWNTPGTYNGGITTAADDLLTWQDSSSHFWMLRLRYFTQRIEMWEYDPVINRWACHLDEDNIYFPAVECEETTYNRPKIKKGEQRSVWVDNCDNAYVFLFDTIQDNSKLWRINTDSMSYTLLNSYSGHHFGQQGILDTANHPTLTTGSISWTANHEFWYRGSHYAGTNTLWKYVPDSVHANFTYTFDSITCETHFLNESTSGCNTIKSWYWDFGDGQTSTLENPSHFYSSSGNYQITLIVENCSWDIDTLIQNVAIQLACPVELEVQFDDSLCIGDCSTLDFESSSIIPLQSILINVVAQSSIDSTEVCPEQTTEYIITGIGENGTVNEDTIVVTILDSPTLYLSDDQTICPPDSITLEVDSDNALYYLWSTGSSANNTIIYSPGDYWVVGENEHCNSSDTVSVTLLCTIILEMPNVFTPINQDGINDIFLPIKHEAISDYKLTIFNRWGHLMFESVDVNEGWDGTFNGEYCQAGTYFWVVEYTGSGAEPKAIHGNLTLIR